MPERQTLLFHCQHALGLGHLVRSLTLASALAEQFEVVLLNGGRFPDGTTVPTGVGWSTCHRSVTIRRTTSSVTIRRGRSRQRCASGVPAVVIPYADGGEDEQRQRAERLDRLGVLRSVPADGLDAERLADAVIADAVIATAASTTARVTLDLDGRDATARMIAELSNANLAGVGR